MKQCQTAAVAAVLLVGMSLAGAARAGNLPYSLSVTPFAGGYVFEGNQHRRDSEVYGLSVGYNFTKSWAVELTGTYSPDVPSTAIPRKQTINLYEIRGDLLYHLLPEQRFVPYVAAGGGVMFFDPRKGSSDGDTLADVGAGFKYFLTDSMALRGDVRYILDFTANDISRTRDYYNNFIYTAGLTFQLGGVKPAGGSAPAEQPAPRVEAAPPAPPAPKPEPVQPAPPPPAPAPAAVPPPPAPVPASVEEAPVTLQAERLGGEVPAGKIVVTGISIDQGALEITTTGRIANYRTFTLSQPSRLVIDIDDAVNGLGAIRVPVHKFGITAVRFGSHPNYLRIVLDAARGKLLSYRIVETGTGLKVITLNP